MSKFFVSLLIVLFPILPLSCHSESTESDDTSSKEPAATAAEKAATDDTSNVSDQPEPFTLTFDQIEPGPNRDVNVSENSTVSIEILSSENSGGEISVLYPDAENAISIGSWKGNSAIFAHSFPYGENHILIMIGDSIYEYLVVSGVSEVSERSEAGCRFSYMTLEPGTTWLYREDSSDEFATDWTCDLLEKSKSENGSTELTLRMIASTGVENREIKSVELHLYCSDNQVYIIEANETEEGKTTKITYEPNSVFIPPALNDGDKWTRKGTMEISSADESRTLEVVESFDVVGQEAVSVSAGEFVCSKVDYTVTAEGDGESSTFSGSSWYAPRIGRILTLGGEGSNRRELVSFEPPPNE